MSKFPFANFLEHLLASLPEHRSTREQIDLLVHSAIRDTQERSTSDNRKNQWEFLLKNEIFRLAEAEGISPDQSYYTSLCNRLDVILSFTEHEACEATFPFTVLEDLLETQTIESCSHIFSWIEKRSVRLTKGMVPQKGKALVLLRTLNELLRRLSKTGNTTTFCGRILTFLSAVFPLGERSGVNLRGDYGPQWDDVSLKRHKRDDEMDVDVSRVDTDDKVSASTDITQNLPEQEAKTSQSTADSDDGAKEKFYNTFWSLQTPFSRPSIFVQPGAFESFKNSVDAIIPVIKEATARERAMMGSKAVVGSLKRKRETTSATAMGEGNRDYFFAKYLTSPELLDLEVSDTVFRRQFLFQLLILLTHLTQFTKAEKAKWATPRNRSLQMDFTLEPDDGKWVQETISKAYEELRQTAPNGRVFSETVQIILDRERNWVRWKNELCSPFDKESLSISLEERAAPLRKKMQEPVEDYRFKLGSEALSEIWAMGYRDLYDLQTPFNPGDVNDFVKNIEKENGRIAMRKQYLAKQSQKAAEARARVTAPVKPVTPIAAQSNAAGEQPQSTSSPSLQPSSIVATPVPQRPALVSSNSLGAPLHPSLPAKPGTKPIPPVPSVAPPASKTPIIPSPIPASVPPPVPPVQVRSSESTDPIIMKAEENKQRLSWLALRTARDEYLHYFGKIGNGDISLLVQEIEKEKERIQRDDSAGPSASGDPTAADVGAMAVDSDHVNTPTSGTKADVVESNLERHSQEQAKSEMSIGSMPTKENETAADSGALVKPDISENNADAMPVDS